MARLDANASVFECLEDRQSLGKQSSLHLFCDFQFLRSTVFCFQPFGNCATLRLHLTGHLVKAYQQKRVSIQISEAREDSTPNGRLSVQWCRWIRRRLCQWPFELDASEARCVLKLNSALAPFRVPGSDIFGNENNLRGPADEPIFPGVGLWRN